MDAVARCLAKQSDKHIGASEWTGPIGTFYRHRARFVITTIIKYQQGAQSGGLPKGQHGK